MSLYIGLEMIVQFDQRRINRSGDYSDQGGQEQDDKRSCEGFGATDRIVEVSVHDPCESLQHRHIGAGLFQDSKVLDRALSQNVYLFSQSNSERFTIGNTAVAAGHSGPVGIAPTDALKQQ